MANIKGIKEAASNSASSTKKGVKSVLKKSDSGTKTGLNSNKKSTRWYTKWSSKILGAVAVLVLSVSSIAGLVGLDQAFQNGARDEAQAAEGQAWSGFGDYQFFENYAPTLLGCAGTPIQASSDNLSNGGTEAHGTIGNANHPSNPDNTAFLDFGNTWAGQNVNVTWYMYDAHHSGPQPLEVGIFDAAGAALYGAPTIGDLDGGTHDAPETYVREFKTTNHPGGVTGSTVITHAAIDQNMWPPFGTASWAPGEVASNYRNYNSFSIGVCVTPVAAPTYEMWVSKTCAGGGEDCGVVQPDGTVSFDIVVSTTSPDPVNFNATDQVFLGGALHAGLTDQLATPMVTQAPDANAYRTTITYNYSDASLCGNSFENRFWINEMPAGISNINYVDNLGNLYDTATFTSAACAGDPVCEDSATPADNVGGQLPCTYTHYSCNTTNWTITTTPGQPAVADNVSAYTSATNPTLVADCVEPDAPTVPVWVCDPSNGIVTAGTPQVENPDTDVDPNTYSSEALANANCTAPEYPAPACANPLWTVVEADYLLGNVQSQYSINNPGQFNSSYSFTFPAGNQYNYELLMFDGSHATNNDPNQTQEDLFVNGVLTGDLGDAETVRDITAYGPGAGTANGGDTLDIAHFFDPAANDGTGINVNSVHIRLCISDEIIAATPAEYRLYKFCSAAPVAPAIPTSFDPNSNLVGTGWFDNDTASDNCIIDLGDNAAGDTFHFLTLVQNVGETDGQAILYDPDQTGIVTYADQSSGVQSVIANGGIATMAFTVASLDATGVYENKAAVTGPNGEDLGHTGENGVNEGVAVIEITDSRSPALSINKYCFVGPANSAPATPGTPTETAVLDAGWKDSDNTAECQIDLTTQPDQLFHFLTVVQNTGTAPANNITISDTSQAQNVIGAWNTLENGPLTINPGQYATLDSVVNVQALEVGGYVNNSVITGAGDDVVITGENGSEDGIATVGVVESDPGSPLYRIYKYCAVGPTAPAIPTNLSVAGLNGNSGYGTWIDNDSAADNCIIDINNPNFDNYKFHFFTAVVNEGPVDGDITVVDSFNTAGGPAATFHTPQSTDLTVPGNGGIVTTSALTVDPDRGYEVDGLDTYTNTSRIVDEEGDVVIGEGNEEGVAVVGIVSTETEYTLQMKKVCSVDGAPFAESCEAYEGQDVTFKIGVVTNSKTPLNGVTISDSYIGAVTAVDPNSLTGDNPNAYVFNNLVDGVVQEITYTVSTINVANSETDVNKVQFTDPGDNNDPYSVFGGYYYSDDPETTWDNDHDTIDSIPAPIQSDEAEVTVRPLTPAVLEFRKTCQEVGSTTWIESCNATVNDIIDFRIEAKTNVAGEYTFTLNDDQTIGAGLDYNGSATGNYTETLSATWKEIADYTALAVAANEAPVGDIDKIVASEVSFDNPFVPVSVSYDDENADGDAWHLEGGDEARVLVTDLPARHITFMKQCKTASMTAFDEDCLVEIGETLDFRILAKASVAGVYSFDLSDSRNGNGVTYFGDAAGAYQGESLTTTFNTIIAEYTAEGADYNMPFGSVDKIFADPNSIGLDTDPNVAVTARYQDDLDGTPNNDGIHSLTGDEARVRVVKPHGFQLTLEKQCYDFQSSSWIDADSQPGDEEEANTQSCANFTKADTVKYRYVIVDNNAPAAGVNTDSITVTLSDTTLANIDPLNGGNYINTNVEIEPGETVYVPNANGISRSVDQDVNSFEKNTAVLFNPDTSDDNGQTVDIIDGSDDAWIDIDILPKLSIKKYCAIAAEMPNKDDLSLWQSADTDPTSCEYNGINDRLDGNKLFFNFAVTNSSPNPGGTTGSVDVVDNSNDLAGVTFVGGNINQTVTLDPQQTETIAVEAVIDLANVDYGVIDENFVKLENPTMVDNAGNVKDLSVPALINDVIVQDDDNEYQIGKGLAKIRFVRPDLDLTKTCMDDESSEDIDECFYYVEDNDVEKRPESKYEIKVCNNGPLATADARDVIIKDTIEYGFDFVSATPAPTNIDTQTDELTWNIGDIAMDDCVTIELVVKANAEKPDPVKNGEKITTISNTAEVFIQDEKQDEDEDVVKIFGDEPMVDLTIEKVTEDYEHFVGDIFDYTIKIYHTAASNIEAENVFIYDDIPGYLEAIDPDQDPVTFNVGTVPLDVTEENPMEYTIKVKILGEPEDNNGEIINTAKIASNEDGDDYEDEDPTNNTDPEPVKIVKYELDMEKVCNTNFTAAPGLTDQQLYNAMSDADTQDTNCGIVDVKNVQDGKVWFGIKVVNNSNTSVNDIAIEDVMTNTDIYTNVSQAFPTTMSLAEGATGYIIYTADINYSAPTEDPSKAETVMSSNIATASFTATVNGEEITYTDSDPAHYGVTDTSQIVYSMKIEKTVADPEVKRIMGDKVDYTVTVTNNGENGADLKDVKVVDDYDNNLMHYVSCSDNCANQGGELKWTLDLAVGESKTFNYTLKVRNKAKRFVSGGLTPVDNIVVAYANTDNGEIKLVDTGKVNTKKDLPAVKVNKKVKVYTPKQVPIIRTGNTAQILTGILATLGVVALITIAYLGMKGPGRFKDAK